MFPSHLAIDASDTISSRTWGPCRPASPNPPSEASYEARNEPEECLDNDNEGRRPRELFVTKRPQKGQDLALFSSHFRGRVDLLKKVPLGAPSPA